jgi:hypothetical protein
MPDVMVSVDIVTPRGAIKSIPLSDGAPDEPEKDRYRLLFFMACITAVAERHRRRNDTKV